MTNRPAFSVDVVPGEVPAGMLPDLLERLAGNLGVEPHRLAERVPRHMRHLFRSVELKRNVDFATIAVAGGTDRRVSRASPGTASRRATTAKSGRSRT